jgi:hypothetical protein
MKRKRYRNRTVVTSQTDLRFYPGLQISEACVRESAWCKPETHFRLIEQQQAVFFAAATLRSCNAFETSLLSRN